MSFRILYAAGPGNVIAAHKHWVKGDFDPSEMSITYSSQFEEFCQETGAEAYIVSYNSQKGTFRDGSFVLEHRPKPMLGASGIRYHISEILYGVGLLATAIRFKANAAVIVSGSTHYFILSLFRMVGIRVVVVLHNTLWPAGYPPSRLIPRFILGLDSLFFRYGSMATIGVSPEAIRQVAQLTRGRTASLFEFRSLFRPEYFEDIPAPGSNNDDVFRILYAGRINRNKGVFDLLAMAKRLQALQPGRTHWTICGSGPDLDELRHQLCAMELESIVSIRGWTDPQQMRDILAECHLSIVPTRSDFTEGMAKTVVESILAGRPVITTPVVPALEMLKAACVEAQTDHVESYVQAILNLINNPKQYRVLCQACPALQRQFYDQNRGLSAVLKRVFAAKRLTRN